jgi:hypothetical protein
MIETSRAEEAIPRSGRQIGDLSGPAAEHESRRTQEPIAPKRDCKFFESFLN